MKSNISDMGENAITGVSETCLTPDDNFSSWNVASSTHELFRCDRSRNSEKENGGGVMLFLPLRLAPKERKDLNIFDKSKFESSWVECHCNFSKDCRSKMLLNVTYNSLKANQIDFFEQVLSIIDKATWESLPG